MTDEKDQANSEATPKYRALRDGTGYVRGDVFEDKSVEIHYKGKLSLKDHDKASITTHYGKKGRWVPIFMEFQLKNSPDFEEVENLWEPEYEEGYWYIAMGVDALNGSVIYSTDHYFRKRIIENGYHFRTESDAQSYLNEVMELIKKRSKESRRLK